MDPLKSLVGGLAKAFAFTPEQYAAAQKFFSQEQLFGLYERVVNIEAMIKTQNASLPALEDLVDELGERLERIEAKLADMQEAQS